MTQHCIACDNPKTIYHWHNGSVRLDVMPGCSGDAVVVLENQTLDADETRELIEKLLEAGAACDRANGVTW